MERWEIVRARIEAQVEKKTYQGECDPEGPWGTVMSHTAYISGLDSAWWFNQLDKPCMSGGRPTPSHQVLDGAPTTGSAQEPAVDLRTVVRRERREVQSADGWRRLQKRDARTGEFQTRPAISSVLRGVGSRMGARWCRQENGCLVIRPFNRTRACEWCLGSHPSIAPGSHVGGCLLHRRLQRSRGEARVSDKNRSAHTQRQKRVSQVGHIKALPHPRR